MLGKPFGAWCAISQCHHRHTQIVEEFARRCHFETHRVVAHIGASAVDNLDSIGLFLLREIPGNIWLNLMRLHIRHLAFWPYIHIYRVAMRFEVSKSVHQNLFGSKRLVELHLTHKFYASFEPECSMAAVGKEMQLGRNIATSEFTIHERRTIRRINVAT